MRADRATRREILRLGTVGVLMPSLAAREARALLQAGQTTAESFLAAVAAGDLRAATGHLDQDPGLLQARDADGRSAFTLALLNRRAELQAMLRARGYALDLGEAAYALDWERFDELAAPAPLAVNDDYPIGGTAMVAAAGGGAGADLWRVYRYHGDPDARGTAPFSPVRAALEVPDLATAEMTLATLLSNGADPNLPQAGGSSPLHAAAARGSVASVEYLLRKGARVEARDAAAKRPIDRAEEGGHRRVFEMLRDPSQIPRDHSTSRDAYDTHGAHYVAPDLEGVDVMIRERMVGQSHGNLETVREMRAAQPALVHAVASTTERAVEAGAHMGRLEVVDDLLEHGAPYSLPTAVVRGDAVRTRELLDEDPLRIHERGAHDFALLWYPVIGGGNLDLAELLLARGVQVEQHHYLGTTALHLAASRGQLEMIDLLIAHRADVNRVGRKFSAAGQTPLRLALDRGQEEAAALLRARGASEPG